MSTVSGISKKCGYCKQQPHEQQFRVCGKCQLLSYCSSECQKAAWRTHKQVCKEPLTSLVNVYKNLKNNRPTSTLTWKAWKRDQLEEIGIGSQDFGKNSSKMARFIGEQGIHGTYAVEVAKDVIGYILRSSRPTNEPSKHKRASAKLEENGDKWLQKQDYVQIIKQLRVEPDGIQRIDWLRTQAKQGHPILMLELSFALLSQNNRSKQDEEEAMQWYRQGLFCCYLDLACNQDETVKESISKLADFYYPASIPLSEIHQMNQKYLTEDFFSKWEPQESHPSPEWMIYHGDAFSKYGLNRMRPSSDWLDCRRQRKAQLILAIRQKNANAQK